MSIQMKDLSVIAYANGFTLWHYTTPDAAEDVLSGGYFDAAANTLRPGDMILTNMNTGKAVTSTNLHVSENAMGSVTVIDLFANP